MPVKSYDIEESVINLPSFDNESWIIAVEQATGLKQEILRIQYNTLLLLKDINDNKASFERLAWFNIWTREMLLLDSVFAASDHNSEFLLQILDRISFELMLHLHTILDPLVCVEKKSKSVSSGPAETRNTMIVDRLRAYTAWCLWNDLDYLQDFTHPETLKHIWSPEPARGIMADSENYAEYVKYYGEIDTETDEKLLAKGLFKQRDRGLHNKHRLQTWLDHKDLIKWKTKLKQLSKFNNSSPSFFSLFDESEKSICKRLKTLNLRFMYVSYIQSSLLIHGSSLETNLRFHEEGFTLNTMKNEESSSGLTKSICGKCMTFLIVLKLLQAELWKQ
jgi:hypothetical protein